MIIRKKNGKACILTDVATPANRYDTKSNGKQTTIQELMNTNTCTFSHSTLY